MITLYVCLKAVRVFTDYRVVVYQRVFNDNNYFDSCNADIFYGVYIYKGFVRIKSINGSHGWIQCCKGQLPKKLIEVEAHLAAYKIIADSMVNVANK